ncbi:MAG: GNAT family N-acetyltransferase [Eubacteriales bacterium]|jgi:predicted acetyltransferase
MIRRASPADKTAVMEMWDRVFGESDAYMELYFTQKYRDDQCYLSERDGVICSSLQVLPYDFGLWEDRVRMGYISGVATLSEFRGQGEMTQLLEGTLRGMEQDGYTLATLIPASSSLFGLYRRFGFGTCFHIRSRWVALTPGPGQMLTPWKGEEIYDCYHRWQSRFPCGVVKSRRDLEVVLREHQAGGGELWLLTGNGGVEGMAFVLPGEEDLMVRELLCRHDQEMPVLRTLMRHYGHEQVLLAQGGTEGHPFGMARAVDLYAMAQQLARRNPTLRREFQVEDPILPRNSGGYQIDRGECIRTQPKGTLLTVEQATVWLLMGGAGAHATQPYMNLMLN